MLRKGQKIKWRKPCPNGHNPGNLLFSNAKNGICIVVAVNYKKTEYNVTYVLPEDKYHRNIGCYHMCCVRPITSIRAVIAQCV